MAAGTQVVANVARYGILKETIRRERSRQRTAPMATGLTKGQQNVVLSALQLGGAFRNLIRNPPRPSRESPPPSTAVGFTTPTTDRPMTSIRTNPIPLAFESGGGGGFAGQGGFSGGNGGFVGELGDVVGIIERGVDIARSIKTLAGGGSGAAGATKQFVATTDPGMATCPRGSFKIGNTCVHPGDLFPGGDPLLTGAGGQAVAGSFGMPAITPELEQRTHRDCPPGMVLGRDNLCYPKQVLPRRSQFRKWKGAQRPALSAMDMKTLRKIDRLQDKVKRINKLADLRIPTRRKR